MKIGVRRVILTDPVNWPAGLSRPQVAAAQLHAEVAGRPFTADRWLTGAADRAHDGPEPAWMGYSGNATATAVE